MRFSNRSRSKGKALFGLLVAILLAGTAASWVSAAREDRARAESPGWSFAAPMPHRRSYTASAESGGMIYVAAGMVGNTGRPLDLFERFDPQRNSWVSLTQLPQPLSAGAAASLGRRIYVIGGNSPTATGRQVYVYEIGRKTWLTTTSLPAPRTNLAAVALGGKIYALGGLDPVRPTSTVYVYDPAGRRWSQAARLPRALHAFGAVVFKGKIWVIGGRGSGGISVRQVWIYDPKRNHWRAGPPLPEPMDIPGVAVQGGRIYAVVDTISVVYDAATGRWRRGRTLRVPRHSLALFTHAGRLYAVGGCLYPQLVDSQVVETMPAAG